jgi:hypothetical protein
MNIFFLIKLGITIGILIYIYQHIGLVLRVIFPTFVSQRFKYFPLPKNNLHIEEILKGKFQYIGCRVENILWIFRKTYYVFYHKKGVYIDVPKRGGKGGYLISKIPDTLFLITKISPATGKKSKGYLSQKGGYSIKEIFKNHKNSLAKLGLGNKPEKFGTPKHRLELGFYWYKKFARLELFSYSILSFTVSVIGFALITRVWTYKITF